jgi:ribosomal protein S18 acetylase RimI-like enzyme
MNIRKFQEKDHEALIALWKRVFPDDPPHNDPAQVLAAKLKVDDLVFVCEEELQIIGACMAGYDGHRGWLYAVAVAPEQRRNGLGTSLVTTALEELRRLGCIKVNIQIRSTNTAVAAFYKALGFATEDRLSMGAFLNDR